MRTDLALLKQSNEMIHTAVISLRAEMKEVSLSVLSLRDWMHRALGAVAVISALGLLGGVGALIWKGVGG